MSLNSFKSLIDQRLIDQFIQQWNVEISTKVNCLCYKSFKTDFKFENYLINLSNWKPLIEFKTDNGYFLGNRFDIPSDNKASTCIRKKAFVYAFHDDVIMIKWKHFPRYWPFARGIHPHKGQQRRALMFSLICALNKWWSKQSWSWWLETPLRPLWRHCNVNPDLFHYLLSWSYLKCVFTQLYCYWLLDYVLLYLVNLLCKSLE